MCINTTLKKVFRTFEKAFKKLIYLKCLAAWIDQTRKRKI